MAAAADRQACACTSRAWALAVHQMGSCTPGAPRLLQRHPGILLRCPQAHYEKVAVAETESEARDVVYNNALGDVISSCVAANGMKATRSGPGKVGWWAGGQGRGGVARPGLGAVPLRHLVGWFEWWSRACGTRRPALLGAAIAIPWRCLFMLPSHSSCAAALHGPQHMHEPPLRAHAGHGRPPAPPVSLRAAEKCAAVAQPPADAGQQRGGAAGGDAAAAGGQAGARQGRDKPAAPRSVPHQVPSRRMRARAAAKCRHGAPGGSPARPCPALPRCARAGGAQGAPAEAGTAACRLPARQAVGAAGAHARARAACAAQPRRLGAARAAPAGAPSAARDRAWCAWARRAAHAVCSTCPTAAGSVLALSHKGSPQAASRCGLRPPSSSARPPLRCSPPCRPHRSAPKPSRRPRRAPWTRATRYR